MGVRFPSFERHDGSSNLRSSTYQGYHDATIEVQVFYEDRSVRILLYDRTGREEFMALRDQHGDWQVSIPSTPMGVCNAPDLAQEIIESVFHDMLEDLEAFIDDIGIFDDDFDTHLAKVEKVLLCLQEKGFTVNRSNANGLCKKRIGLVFGSLPMVQTMEKEDRRHFETRTSDQHHRTACSQLLS